MGRGLGRLSAKWLGVARRGGDKLVSSNVARIGIMGGGAALWGATRFSDSDSIRGLGNVGLMGAAGFGAAWGTRAGGLWGPGKFKGMSTAGRGIASAARAKTSRPSLGQRIRGIGDSINSFINKPNMLGRNFDRTAGESSANLAAIVRKSNIPDAAWDSGRLPSHITGRRTTDRMMMARARPFLAQARSARTAAIEGGRVRNLGQQLKSHFR